MDKQELWQALKYPPKVLEIQDFFDKHMNSFRHVQPERFEEISNNVRIHANADDVQLFLEPNEGRVIMKILIDGNTHTLKFDR